MTACASSTSGRLGIESQALRDALMQNMYDGMTIRPYGWSKKPQPSSLPAQLRLSRLDGRWAEGRCRPKAAGQAEPAARGRIRITSIVEAREIRAVRIETRGHNANGATRSAQPSYTKGINHGVCSVDWP